MWELENEPDQPVASNSLSVLSVREKITQSMKRKCPCGGQCPHPSQKLSYAGKRDETDTIFGSVYLICSMEDSVTPPDSKWGVVVWFTKSTDEIDGIHKLIPYFDPPEMFVRIEPTDGPKIPFVRRNTPRWLTGKMTIGVACTKRDLIRDRNSDFLFYITMMEDMKLDSVTKAFEKYTSKRSDNTNQLYWVTHFLLSLGIRFQDMNHAITCACHYKSELEAITSDEAAAAQEEHVGAGTDDFIIL